MTSMLEQPRTPTGADAKIYRAAVVHDFTKPLTIDEVGRPELGHGQILVKVEASGLCHTDIHASHGDWPVKPTPPFVPGHEGVGIVVALGGEVTEVGLGDRVAMPWLGYACGVCDYCVSARETLCLAVFGVGGLGHMAIQYAQIAGGRVIAVDLVDEKLDLARELGAGFTVNAAKENPVGRKSFNQGEETR